MQTKTKINLSSSTQDILEKAQSIGLLEEWDWEGYECQIVHPDGERITFDTTEDDLVSYLEGLLKSWDLIQCGIVKLEPRID